MNESTAVVEPDLLSTDPLHGLSDDEAARRRARGFGNDTTVRPGRSIARIVADNVFTRINGMLAVLLVLVLIYGSWINGAFGLLIIANSAIGIIQEVRAKRTLDALSIVSEAKARVVRSGEVREVSRTDVVLGDIIDLGAGDQVIVDGEVKAASHLSVDESLLTGEADAVPKQRGDEVLSGSFTAAGSGRYVATRVGAQAYAAQLAAEAGKYTLTASELRGGIDKILRIITWLLIPAGALTIYTQIFRSGQPLNEAIVAMVAALVPMIPEGLVLMTSIAFAVGVVRLGRYRCLVQELPAIEMLARVDTVCLDKTGTLTTAQMSLREIRLFAGTALTPGDVAAVLEVALTRDDRPNATARAVLDGLPDWLQGQSAEAKQMSQVTRPLTVTDDLPFSSAVKYSGMATADGQTWLFGAGDILAADSDEVAALNAEGLRVLVLARSAAPLADFSAVEHLPKITSACEPVALVVLEQQLRPEAQETLEYFAAQDVAVKVISGDNATSVHAVTARLGVTSEAEAVDARTLPPRGTPEFAETIRNTAVFGRVRPDQKRAIVQSLQADGHLVAMTGDGVNDVLALKDSAVGVAMGDGAPATRSVAQIVLLNNSFASLPKVVAEGRRVIGNIERVATLFLTKTVYSVVLALLVGISGFAFPFQPIHITLTGWFTIGIPAFILSLAPNADRARSGFVRRVLRLALPAGVIIGTVVFATLYLVYPGADAPEDLRRQASTGVLVAMLMIGVWVLGIVARPWNLWRFGLVAGAASFYILIFSIPPVASLLLLDPRNIGYMLVGLIAGAIGIVLVESAWWMTGLFSQTPRRMWVPGVGLSQQSAP